jgi:hypothetical protein
MAENDKEELHEKVQQFLKRHNDFDDKKNLSVVCDEGDSYYILYGEDIAVGVAGIGQNPEAAFKDFIDNWHRYRGDKLEDSKEQQRQMRYT